MQSAARFTRIGNVHSRTKYLIRGGVLPSEKRPVWFDVWEAFPPVILPSFFKPKEVKRTKIPLIFYREDKIRAAFYHRFPKAEAIDMTTDEPSVCERFVKTYTELKESGESKEGLFDMTVKILQSEGHLRR